MRKLGSNTGPATKEDSLRIFNPIRKKDIVPVKKKDAGVGQLITCADWPPVSSRPLPPRVPSNYLTQYKIEADGTVSPIAIIRQSLASYTEKMWEPGETITVGFDISGASINQMNQVKQYAKEWELYANIKFEFLQSGSGMIRVGFAQGGSYSLIGRDALLQDPNKTTMNLGWLTTVSEAFARQVILHEFGHALGFIHEHQSAGAAIPWNKENVYAYYSGPPNEWTREQVEFVFQLGETNGRKVSWWKEIGVPVLSSGQASTLWIQNHSLIPAENRTRASGQLPFADLNKNAGISFAKAKVLGAHTPLSYKWNVLQALTGGCRVTLTWRKDSCL